MKELNTNKIGRMPFWQADLDWLQAAYTEPLVALVSELGLSRDYFIITGCTVTIDGSRMSMSAGWFWYGGRILPVRELLPTSVASLANPMVRLTPVQYANPDGARSFIRADHQSAVRVTDVWIDDYLNPSVVERHAHYTSGVRIGKEAWTLRDILGRNRQECESDWIPTATGSLYYKRLGRMVVLRGVPDGFGPDMYTPVDSGLPAPLGGWAVLTIANDPGDLNIRIDGQGKLYCTGSTQGEPLLTGMTYLAETTYIDNDVDTINDNPATNQSQSAS